MAVGVSDNRVDQVLETVEHDTPSIHALRRVPMDLIAAAVRQELRQELVMDRQIAEALLAIARRNGMVISGPTFNPSRGDA